MLKSLLVFQASFMHRKLPGAQQKKKVYIERDTSSWIPSFPVQVFVVHDENQEGVLWS